MAFSCIDWANASDAVIRLDCHRADDDTAPARQLPRLLFSSERKMRGILDRTLNLAAVREF